VGLFCPPNDEVIKFTNYGSGGINVFDLLAPYINGDEEQVLVCDTCAQLSVRHIRPVPW
jgi:hypothetical protein